MLNLVKENDKVHIAMDKHIFYVDVTSVLENIGIITWNAEKTSSSPLERLPPATTFRYSLQWSL